VVNISQTTNDAKQMTAKPITPEGQITPSAAR